ncbi:MAG: CbtA family protein [Chloroflexi bacterium]|nr:CbtA family protein [Chloroflexota bacterium]
MRTGRLYSVFKAAIIAGLAAGLAMGLFHFLLTEPVIDRAIALEEAAAQSYGVTVVSREVQKGMLVIGSALYGALVGIIFALIFTVLERHLPSRRPDIKAVALAGLMWWSVALFPFLKYPANPPGVGDPDTMYFRQVIQFGFMAFSALTMVIAGAGYWRLRRQWLAPRLRRWRLGIAIGLYGFLAMLLFILMPANPDPILVPSDLLRDFRILSLSGQVLFWVGLGGVSALLLRRYAGKELLRE